MAERNVLDADEDLVLTLLVQHLVPGVAGVGQNGADSELVPCEPRAVLVRPGVVRGRAGDVVAGQALGDGVEAVPGGELGEDPARDAGLGRESREPAELANGPRNGNADLCDRPRLGGAAV